MERQSKDWAARFWVRITLHTRTNGISLLMRWLTMFFNRFSEVNCHDEFPRRSR